MTPFPAPSAWARRLGYAGLLPFIAGAAAVALADGLLRARFGGALLAYAATIVSFLGGIHWGAAMRQGDPSMKPWVWGITPQLIAWLALLLPLQLGLAVTGALLMLSYGVDRRLYPDAGLGNWLSLRLPLSLGAAASCLFAAALL